jgi:hypothetical protein
MKYVKLRWQPDDTTGEETVFVYGVTDQLLQLLDQAVETTDGDDVLSLRQCTIQVGEIPRPMIFRARRIRSYEVME